MPTFDYVAVDGAGLRTAGRASADTERDLAASLRREGRFLLKARPEASRHARAVDRPIPPKVLSDYTERVEILVKAGIPLADALRRIADDTDHDAAAEVFDAVATSVEAGRPFAESLADFPRAFDATYRAVVSAGEASGSLDETLATLAVKLIRRHEAAKRLRSALAYPCALGFALVGLFLIIVLVLIPKFSAVFDKAGVAPPASTRAVLAVKEFLFAHGVAVAVAAAAAVAAFVVGLRRRGFRAAVEAAVRRIPGVGAVVEMSEAHTFAHLLGLLNKYGVILTRALEISGAAARTVRMKASIARVAQSVVAGGGLADAVRTTGTFPPLVVQMIEVGERSGSLDEALGRVEAYYDREVPRAVDKLLGMLGPALTLGSGVAVGFAIFSVIQPLMSVLKALKG